MEACRRCGRPLKDEKSIALGFGRTCRKKFEVEEAEFRRIQITIDDALRIHRLKIMPEYFKAVASKAKRFEIRKNDRDYKIGDGLLLREFKDDDYTGNEINAVITYMTDYEQKKGYVVMGIEVCA
ncbi:DUF3850 domain-containing protein [Sporosarcina saromensis]|uniref:DUF3850 domain-containing protein n=1 Tax=Sporosarcina saromensis TaxID=359365 RepID=UPI00295EDDD6|nr:DUF3850 domain-containing protein [Sporosarcina saromensis]